MAFSTATACAGQTCSSGVQTPIPCRAVQIENTNASFSLSDVDVPQVNPARPTASVPARIPPTGYLQFEQGLLLAGNSPSGTKGQLAFSQTTKISLTTRVLVALITQPYAYSTLDGTPGRDYHSSDSGDLQVGVQAIVHKAVGALPSIAVGFDRRVRTGTSASLDSGEYSQSAILFFGGDLRRGFHYDSNALFNEVDNGSARRAQFAQTLAVSHGIFPSVAKGLLGGTVELSHFTQPFVQSTSAGTPVARANAVDLLLVGTFTMRPNLIFDVSVDRGLTSTSTHWQGGFGFSYIFPHRLWPDRHPKEVPIRKAGHSGL